MTIEINSDDILHFLIKEKQTKWSLSELSQKLLIPKWALSGILVGL